MAKKILAVVGARPNFIKITQLEKELAAYGDYFEYKLIHTGQHYDYNMSDVFFQQLKIKSPDYFLGVKPGSPNQQIGNIIIEIDKILESFQPDLMLVVGDVNSTMAASIAANKRNIRIAHIESGLRSFDREMPEEINRLVTDTIADYFFVTEESGSKHLLNEGKQKDQIFFVGNTMIDTLVAFQDEIEVSDILERNKLTPQKYVLITIHRPSNVDEKENLEKVLKLISMVSQGNTVFFPIHPRTLDKISKFGLKDYFDSISNIIVAEPQDYFSFQKLIANSRYIITDSGGIQEEATFRKIPCLTLRNNTERPVTVDIGSNELLEFNESSIQSKIDQIQSGNFKKGQIPTFWDGKATKRIVEVLKRIA